MGKMDMTSAEVLARYYAKEAVKAKALMKTIEAARDGAIAKLADSPADRQMNKGSS